MCTLQQFIAVNRTKQCIRKLQVNSRTFHNITELRGWVGEIQNRWPQGYRRRAYRDVFTACLEVRPAMPKTHPCNYIRYFNFKTSRNVKQTFRFITALICASFIALPVKAADIDGSKYAEWRLPDVAPSPSNNKMNQAKFELGKMLFYDPRLSRNGNMSCATCHDPKNGWSDGLPTAKGHNGKTLGRATPTIVNVGFNKILMWDGRAKSLEDQALGPIYNPDEMANNRDQLLKTLRSIPGYVTKFKEAFWGLDISEARIAKSIAMFQRRVVGNRSPFDRWIAGDPDAMTEQQVRGFEIFNNPMKGNCSTCHRPPNFTDNGFHNIGLKSYGRKNPDLGRFKMKNAIMAKGAFKTPPLRNISQTAPYFHDGSAKSLSDVVKHYQTGGVVKSNLSPNMRQLSLSQSEQKDLVAFLNALTSDIDPSLMKVTLPD